MKFYHVEPEVPGGLGEGTVFDRSGRYLKVTDALVLDGEAVDTVVGRTPSGDPFIARSTVCKTTHRCPPI